MSQCRGEGIETSIKEHAGKGYRNIDHGKYGWFHVNQGWLYEQIDDIRISGQSKGVAGSS